jgi:hypothetical protein
MKKLFFVLALLLTVSASHAQQIWSEDFQSYQGFGDQPTGGWSTSGVGGFKVYIRGSSNGNIKVCEITLTQNKRSDSLTTPSFGPLSDNATLSFNSRLLDSYIGNFPGFRHVNVAGDKVSAYISSNGGPFQFLQDLLSGYPTSGTDFGSFTLPLNGFSGASVKVKFVVARTSGEMIPSFDNFVASNITSNKSIKIASELNLYPNPSNGQVLLTAPGFSNRAQVEVFNILGSKVHSGNLNNEKSNLDLSELKSGVYLVKVTEGKQVAVSRLILK